MLFIHSLLAILENLKSPSRPAVSKLLKSDAYSPLHLDETSHSNESNTKTKPTSTPIKRILLRSYKVQIFRRKLIGAFGSWPSSSHAPPPSFSFSYSLSLSPFSLLPSRPFFSSAASGIQQNWSDRGGKNTTLFRWFQRRGERERERNGIWRGLEGGGVLSEWFHFLLSNRRGCWITFLYHQLMIICRNHNNNCGNDNAIFHWRFLSSFIAIQEQFQSNFRAVSEHFRSDLVVERCGRWSEWGFITYLIWHLKHS